MQYNSAWPGALCTVSYIVTACLVMMYIVMAYRVTACVDMAYVVMPYIVMAYIVMALCRI